MKKTLENAESQRIFELLDSQDWPLATDPTQICDENSAEDKIERAQGIIEVCVNKNLKDLVVLDYGCGEGHVAYEVSQQGAAMSIGYDIESTTNSIVPFEERRDTLLLTTDIGRVKVNTYDVIIIYDVLDHSSSPIDVLKNCESMLRPDGEIYLRTHPFCSRHGGHTYKILNKAFAHLILNDQELKDREVAISVEQEILFPIKTYSQLFEEAGLVVKEKNIIKETVEPFFRNKPLIKNRLMKLFGTKEFPEFQMSVSFIDYVLGKPE